MTMTSSLVGMVAGVTISLACLGSVIGRLPFRGLEAGESPERNRAKSALREGEVRLREATRLAQANHLVH